MVKNRIVLIGITNQSANDYFSTPNTTEHKQEIPGVMIQARHLIENFFAKLKQYRAIATRYDQLKVNFIGATVIWLN